MKLYQYTLAILLTFSSFEAVICQESTTIVFSYDEGGNMIERKIQVFPQGRFRKPEQPLDTNLVEEMHLLKIFPNPANDYLTVEGELPKGVSEAKIQVLNMNGQTLKTDIYSGSTKQIDVTNLVKGMYLLEFLYSEKKRSTYKIIIN